MAATEYEALFVVPYYSIPEYPGFDEPMITIEVDKDGGGTVGESHSGSWSYLVKVRNKVLEEGDGDLNTPMPHTHLEAARIIADGMTFYHDGELDHISIYRLNDFAEDPKTGETQG